MNDNPYPTSWWTDRKVSVVAHAATVAVAATATVLHRAVARRYPKAAGAIMPALAVGSWAVIHTAERRRPFRQQWTHDQNDTRTDLASFVSMAAPRAIGLAVGTAVGKRLGVRVRLDRLPSVVAIPAAILAYDLWHTTYHRISHQWGPAWTLHAVHHSPRRLYWLNAFRFHVGEVAVDAVGESVLSALFPLAAHQRTGYELMRAVYGNLQHANIALDSGPLNRVFSTPDLHRWHHSEIYDEGDTNYGAVTSVWDQAMGSYYDPDRPFDSKLGVGRMPEFPTTWRGLLRAPVDWNHIKQRNAATWYDAEPLTALQVSSGDRTNSAVAATPSGAP